MTQSPMASVTIREVRNHGGDIVDRVERGETLTVTRDDRPVAQLSPLSEVATYSVTTPRAVSRPSARRPG
ncbi:MAG: type II toxin-antitoxin system Phd/YefM family antitoxin [Acidimicrobiales bacterium]